MRKPLIKTACTALVLIGSGITVAHAAADASASSANPYLALSGDFTWPNRADRGGGGRVALGGRVFPADFGSFRGEIEAAYHSADGDGGHGDVRYFNYMANAYYDFTSRPSWIMTDSWNMTPYVGAGLGLASIRRGRGDFASTFHHHGNAFAYQGMGGLAFVSSHAPSAEWIVEYRYLGTSRDNRDRLHAHNLGLGLRYHF